MDPRDVHQKLLPEIQEGLTFLAAGYPIAELGETFEKLSEYLQALGICHLLESADQDEFRVNLVRSAQARRFYLRKCREGGIVGERRLALSRGEAFLDAVAAGHAPLAREIADLSISSWEPAWEYEDDFCYYLFIHRAVLRPDELPSAETAALLKRFETALEGAASPRLDLCISLATRDPAGLSGALTALIVERQDRLDEKRPVVEEADFLYWPRSFIFIEALAWLKIAAWLGLALEEDLPLCPRIARLADTDRIYPDVFQEIEQELGRPETTA